MGQLGRARVSEKGRGSLANGSAQRAPLYCTVQSRQRGGMRRSDAPLLERAAAVQDCESLSLCDSVLLEKHG
jgi:hypothetical protein